MSKMVWSTLLTALLVTSCTGGGDPVALPSASTALGASVVPATRTIATRLPLPWGLAFLPDGTALVTLRDRGEVRRIPKRGAPVSVGRVPGVVPGGEGGLLGIAVSPRFASDRAVFLYLTSAVDNRVVRMTFDGRRLKGARVIVKGIPKATFHNGGRIAFGPDRFLYIATGDAGRRPLAQNKRSLGGKILRVTGWGAPAPGNPFPRSRIWSLGHRNVQGLAWSKTGAMYASELGAVTWDELNRIRPGRNYGWPIVEGIGRRAGFVNPIRQWRTADASPSGIAVGADGAIYMAALRGQSLWRIPLNARGQAGTPKRLLRAKYGRLRTVVSAPDGRLWLMTSNTLQNTARPGDDRIVSLRVPVR